MHMQGTILLYKSSAFYFQNFLKQKRRKWKKLNDLETKNERKKKKGENHFFV